MKLISLLDNAMLYKDVTQWLRRRTFASLFFGLLGAAEVTSLMVAMMDLDQGESGPAVFTFLLMILCLYLLTLAFMAHNLFRAEFRDRTFELFEAAGMSLEKMIAGKLVSAQVEFFFGFFAIVPFALFGYLLGGLDFLGAFASLFLLFAAAPPLFLLLLFLAALTRNKRLVRAVNLIIGIGVFLCIFPGTVIVIEIFFDHGAPYTDIAEAAKLLLIGSADAWQVFGFAAALYVCACSLLFYLCCHAISPVTDSRESPVKALVFFTFALSMTVSLVVTGGLVPDEWVFTLLWSLYLTVLVMGLGLGLNRRDPPLMARRRMEEARGTYLRCHYWLFRAGAGGTLRTVCLLYVVYLVWAAIAYVAAGKAISVETLTYIAMPLSATFYLAFPTILLARLGAARRDINFLRSGLIAWWIASGIVLTIALGSASSGFDRYSTLLSYILAFVAFFASPISTIFAVIDSSSPVREAAPVLRIVMGLIGLFLLWRLLPHLPGGARPAPSPATAPTSHDARKPDDKDASQAAQDARED